MNSAEEVTAAAGGGGGIEPGTWPMKSVRRSDEGGGEEVVVVEAVGAALDFRVRREGEMDDEGKIESRV